MRLLLRIGAIAVAGAALYMAGAVNSLILLRPSAVGALFAVAAVGAALVLLALALLGTGRGDAAGGASPVLARPMRATFLFVSAMTLFSLAWFRGIPAPPVHDVTTYHNDAITLNECAAQELLAGADPYATFGIFDCYGRRQLGPDRTTPLRRGAFASAVIYPSEPQMDAVWAQRLREVRARITNVDLGPPPDFEFIWRPSYPSLSILLVVPWVALGWDTNALYVLCLVAAMTLVLVRAPAGSRPFFLTGLLGAVSITAFTVGGSGDLLYALPLVAAWLWRERRWSAVALGVAVSVKQLAWPFAAFYLIQVAAQEGSREAARRAAIAAGLFAAVNVPFVLWDANAWLAGILTPVSEPAFPRGAGLVLLSTNGVLPLLPSAAYLGLEVAAAAAVLVLGWRTRRTSPELGVVLAMVPLWFAWRSLFSYFFLLPLFALAGLARMPAGELSSETAREAGALTVLAMPAPAPRGSRT